MDNSEHSKEELTEDNSQIHPFKRLSKFLTKSTPINQKRMSQPIKRMNNLLDSTNNVNKASTPRKPKNKKDKHLLILHKINIKDTKNNYYKKGINDIFNDENLFLSHNYQDKPVIVGKNKASLFYLKYYNNNNGSQRTQNINNFGKKRLYRSTMTNKDLFIIKENGQKTRNSSETTTNDLRKNKFVDRNIKIAYDFQNNKNNMAFNAKSILGKYDILKSMFNIYGKRAPIFYSSDSYITDGELKIIYQKFINKVQDSKKKELLKLKLDNKKYVQKDEDKTVNEKEVNQNNNNNSSLYKKIYKTTIDKEMYARLGLQEKILNKFQHDKKENQKLIHKIKTNINKSSDDLLINQIDDYRYKLEKIEQNERKNLENNHNKTIYWLSSLRNYPQNSKRNENENSLNNTNNSTLPIIRKNNSSTNSVKYNTKDDIYDNYINNIQYSFGNNSNLYCDIESNIRPLCGLIMPENYKENEKITNTHIDDNLFVNKNINNNSIYNIKQIKKNVSTPNLINKSIDNELKIEGKGLLEYEIGIYKELKGKRKKLVKMNYNDEDVDSKIFAKSYLLNNFYFPKAVKNTFDLH